MSARKDLLAKGCDFNKKYKCGQSIFHVAVLKRRHEVEVIKLLNYGADVNVVDDKGNTPLYSAVRYWTGSPSCQCEAVKVLLDAGADVNALNITQQTTYSLAVNAAKLDFSVIQKSKHSPLYIAMETPTHIMHVTELLLQYDTWCSIPQIPRAKAL